MIQSEQPIVKTITLTYEIAHILIQKINGEWRSEVQTTVKDQDGNFIQSIVNTYNGEDYNNWWNDFNSGRFVAEEVITKNNISVTIPPTIEDDFINPVNEQINE